MTFLARLPTSIARAVTVQRAKVAARKTVTGFLCSAASVAVANCVRSPHSAMKITTKELQIVRRKLDFWFYKWRFSSSWSFLRHIRNANSINKTAAPMLTHCLGSKPKALPKLTATTL